MLRLSDALERELTRRPDYARFLDARQALWLAGERAYWHGVFAAVTCRTCGEPSSKR